jgi:xanthine/CO dehydrogenase XdhC/CoxF family maturation factor
MHLGLATLLDFYHAHRTDDALVLGTVIATEGSTYRKPGAMMLIADDGSHCGLISGGCLESDLAQHASDVFRDGEIRHITYDLSAGDELVWGLGIGCDGVIQLMLQRLPGERGFGFLETLQLAWQARQDGVLGLVTESSDTARPAGSFILDCGDQFRTGDLELLNHVHVPAELHDRSRRFWKESITTAQGSEDVLLVPVIPPTALLICGAGVDAVPVARLAIEMGWDCTVVDHRPGFASPERFPDACDVRLLQPGELGEKIDLAHMDAVVTMSHNLAHDRQYLAQVVDAGLSYIGMLGPRARRDRLLEEIGRTNGENGLHVHGPTGLDIGAEMPTSIALSIIGEIHACLNRRHGSHITPVGT